MKADKRTISLLLALTMVVSVFFAAPSKDISAASGEGKNDMIAS